jgi:hypothetical protein
VNKVKSVVEVKGEVLIALPLFIKKKFGQDKLDHWLKTLSPEAMKVYRSPILANGWYPIRETIIEPTIVLCDMFYNKSLLGAWECGKFSAEVRLKGIRKVLAKLGTPQVLIKKASAILPTYYRPTKLEIVENVKNTIVFRITEFADIDKVIEYRIAGWIQRGGQISGGTHVDVKITKSLTQGDPYTEFYVTWK